MIRTIALGVSLFHATETVIASPTAGAHPPVPQLWGPATTALTPAETERADAMVARLRRAEEDSVADPHASTSDLEEALSAVHEDPGLASRSPEVLEARMYALLTLARVQLARGDREAATASIDEAIRTARGDALPMSGVTPELRTLYQERLTAPDNRPSGTLHVTCELPCRAIVNERQAGSGHDILLTGVPLGRHRLHIEALDQSAEPLTQTIALTDDAHEQSVVFSDEPTPAPTDALTPQDDDRDRTKRRFPRWAGIVGMTAGAALLTSGAVLLAYDGRCSDGSSDPATSLCPDVYEFTGAGIGLTVTGAAALIGFSIALGVSEARHRRSDRVSVRPGGLTLRW